MNMRTPLTCRRMASTDHFEIFDARGVNLGCLHREYAALAIVNLINQFCIDLPEEIPGSAVILLPPPSIQSDERNDHV